MAMKITQKGKIAKQALADFPDTGIRTLARKLVSEHPRLFPNFDSAKGALAYHSGLRGGAMRDKLADRSLVRESKLAPSVAVALASSPTISMLPQSFAVPRPAYQLGASRTLLLGDIHIPYQDNAALAAAIDFGVAAGCDAVVLQGDLMDCHELSDHEKDPESRSFEEERRLAKQFLDVLRAKFPTAKIVYKQGNHEMRLQRYLARNAPALVGCEEFRLDVLLGLFDRRIDWVDGKRRIKIGPHFSVFHGDEYMGQGGVNPARSLRMKSGVCGIAAHNHRTSEDTFRNADDVVLGCWSTGCLCDLHPLYMPYNNWNLGFAIVDLHADGGFKVHNHKIIKRRDGTCEVY